MMGPAAGGSLLRRFARHEGGAHAIEFALISAVFITTMIALFQFMLIYMARESLEAALQIATRKVLVGSFQQANAGSTNQAQILATMKALMCGTAGTPGVLTFKCDDMKVDVAAASSFTSRGAGSSAIDGGTGTWSPNFGTSYTCPGPGSVAVIRVAVKYSLIARGFAFGLSDFSDGSALLQSAAVFRVEQYQSGSSSAC